MSKEEFTFVVSDIHGRVDLLQKCITAIESYSDSGKVIFTGDYIDRGPNSKEVLDLLITGPTKEGWTWEFIRGNHEDLLLDAFKGINQELWIMNGGNATLDSYGDGNFDLIPFEWLENLPRLLWDDLRVYVHAGVDETVPLEEQDPNVTQWARYRKGDNIGYNGRHVVHGHTPQKHGPELYEKRTNLDTGGVFTGNMVVGVFNNKVGKPIDLLYVKEDELEK